MLVPRVATKSKLTKHKAVIFLNITAIADCNVTAKLLYDQPFRKY